MTTAAPEAAIYLDPERAVSERVDDLLGRMTLDEKLGQLGSAWSFELAEGGAFSAEQARRLARDGLGQVTRVGGASGYRSDEAAQFANAVQRFLVEETRLGIPAIVHEEICSGLMARGSTIFPQAIGLASTWDPGLAETLADAVRVQMRAVGAQQGLSPVLDVCRDPRWGRTEETFGEDPYLVSRMGIAFVRGLQGADLRSGVVATGKHFVGYGASEGGLNWAPMHAGARELHDVFLHPFEAAVREGGLLAVMNAYNELDGVPCGASHELLTELLRATWGFDGCVVSDYFAVRQLESYHRLVADAPEAGAEALLAGIDVELPSTDCYGTPLRAAIERGLLAEADVDTAVRRVLTTKFALGLFEQPYVDPEVAAAASDTEAHRALARTIAAKSLVLLANDGTLPLAPGLAVAVIGPNADDRRNLLGDYAYPAHVESLEEMARTGGNVFSIGLPGQLDFGDPLPVTPTVLGALRDRLGERVVFAKGCDVSGPSRDGFAEAVAAAAAADVAVLVLGDKAGLTDDCTSGESRDRASLDLPGVQEDLARAVLETGTPVVLVLVAGRPCGSASLHEQSAAVLLAWLPGQAGADAIADAIVGASSPGGKLPITFPRSAGQIPTYYAHKVSGGRSHWKGDYVDSSARPLYAFGHGLSYTTFALSAATVETPTVGWNDSIAVSARVSNTGERAGDEVVQLYVRDPVATITRPVLELKSFVRVELAPGESRTVRFSVPVGQLGFHDRSLAYAVEPGDFEFYVGTSSVDLLGAGSATVVAEPAGSPPAKAFDGAVSVMSAE
ncbi:MAG TPA: glycoside hydrolase family 3 N-terminal domain-containing protein [Gaiellaceae bacterium]|nr:glycoside hydrolase family 3 N-terminal domain-containing protein [Gaiellaceae bacterium]